MDEDLVAGYNTEQQDLQLPVHASDMEQLDDNDYSEQPAQEPRYSPQLYQQHTPAPENESFISKAGHAVYNFGKNFLTDLNVFEPDIGWRERLYRAANVGTFFLPPMKVGMTAGLAVRAGVRALEAGAITGGLSALHGGQSVTGSALTGAGIGATIEALLTRGRVRGLAARSAEAGAVFRNPDSYANAASTPLHNRKWAMFGGQMVDGDTGAALQDPFSAMRHQQLGENAKRIGLDPIEAKGTAAGNTSQDQWFMPEADRRTALELARAHGQKHVLTNEGLFDLDAQTISPINRASTRFGDNVDATKPFVELPGIGRFQFDHEAPLDFSGNQLQPLTDLDEKFRALRGSDEAPLVDRVAQLPVASKVRSWYIKTVRSFAEVERMENMLGKDDGLSAGNLIQLAGGASGFAHAAVTDGIHAMEDPTKIVHGPLTEALSGLRTGDWEKLDNYGKALYWKHLASDRGFQLPALPNGQRLTDADLDGVINDVTQNAPHLVDIRNKVQQWREALMEQTLVKGGLMTPDTYNAIVGSTDQFVPLRRAFDVMNKQLRDEYAPGVKIMRNPIGHIGALGTQYEPWLDTVVKDAFTWSKMAHEQAAISKLREVAAKNPVAARSWMQRVALPAGQMARWQKEAVAAIANTDPMLAMAMEKGSTEISDLLAPVRARKEGILGALVQKKEAFYKHAETGEEISPEEYNKLVPEQAPELGGFTQAQRPMYRNRLTGEILTPREFDNGVVQGSIANADAFEELKQPLPFFEKEGAAITAGQLREQQDIAAAVQRQNDYRNGFQPQERDVIKREWWQVTNPDLWEAFHAMQPASQNLFVKIASSVASTLRAGATLSFEFMGRNPIKDFMTAKTLDGSLTLKDWTQGFAHAIGQDATYNQWLASGGGRATFAAADWQSTRELMNAGIQAADQSHGLGKLYNVVKSPIGHLQLLSDYLESATRVGVYTAKYRHLVQNGMVPAEATRRAALASRNATVDFAVHGSRTQAVRSIAAFWNAGLQGYDNLVRQFAHDPAGATMRAVAGITVPSTILYFVNRQDPEYFQLPEWERTMFWHVKVPSTVPWVGDKWVRLPKPFDLGIFFGTSVERVLQAIDEQNPRAIDSLAQGYFSKMLGDAIPWPTVAKPIIESAINKSFLTNRPIESRALEDIAPEYRSTATTSEFAKHLGMMLGVSPIQLDHFFGSYTGGIGRMGSDLADLAFDMHDTPVQAPYFDPSRMPGLRGFFSQFPRQAEPVDKFYEAADQVRQAEATRSKLENTLRMDDMADWMEKKAVPLGMADLVKGAQGMLKTLRDRRDMILADKQMPRRERADALDQISRAMLQYAAAYQPVMDMLNQQE